jgi:putative inorganic carbon (HCO3(-)) transporter
MQPFFKDHTSYGAILVMYLPVLVYLLYHYQKPSLKFYATILVGIFLIGVIFSYTRAAWLSLEGSIVLWAVYKLKIRFSYILGLVFVLGVMLAISWSQIMINLEKKIDES